MSIERFDLVVLGAGSGGVRAARIAASSLPARGRPSNAERCEIAPPGSRWPTMARQWRKTTDSAGASRLEV